MELNKAFELQNGISFNDNTFIFEGIDPPDVALNDPNIPAGSIYIRYGEGGGTFQKTSTSSGNFIQFGGSSGGDSVGNIDGGRADTIYGGSSPIVGGRADSFGV